MTDIDSSESTLKQESVVESPEKREGRSLSILAATVSSALALSLLIAGFILYIYWYERWSDLVYSGTSWRDSDFIDEMRFLELLSSVSWYARLFGDLSAILALFMIVRWRISERSLVRSYSCLSRKTLVTLSRLLMLMLVLSSAWIALAILVAESDLDFEYDVARALSRANLYLSSTPWIVGAAGLLLVSNDLRKGTFARRPEAGAPWDPGPPSE
ncbi:MAG: hypothetical protein JW880_00495 [Candidatus Thermoplasmatota archaeon]|nr:hypothetical protein [Candidatus Thermoplasmatota archaeon]